MPSTLRLFVAWPLPEALSRELGRVVAPLRSRLPAATWPRSEAIHLTFAFLGDTAPERVPAIAAALDSSADVPALEVRAAGVGVFPNERRPRVAWVGIEPPEPVVELAGRIRAALASTGVAFDEKPFRPHLTIARVRAPWRAKDVSILGDALRAWTSPEARLDRIALFESRLMPEGAVHAALHWVELRR